MGDEAARLFRLAIDAYVDGDAAMAAALDDLDDRLDDLHQDYIAEIFEAGRRRRLRGPGRRPAGADRPVLRAHRRPRRQHRRAGPLHGHRLAARADRRRPRGRAPGRLGDTAAAEAAAATRPSRRRRRRHRRRPADDDGGTVRVLVTNDDGIEAPGLHALAVALDDDGHDVLVVAPATDHSGYGAAIGDLGRGPTSHTTPATIPGAGAHRRLRAGRPARPVRHGRPARRLRRPARPGRLGHQPGQQHRPGRPALGHRRRRPHRRQPRRVGPGRLGRRRARRHHRLRRRRRGRRRRRSPGWPRRRPRPCSTSTCPPARSRTLRGSRWASLAPFGTVRAALHARRRGRAPDDAGRDRRRAAPGLRHRPGGRRLRRRHLPGRHPGRRLAAGRGRDRPPPGGPRRRPAPPPGRSGETA